MTVASFSNARVDATVYGYDLAAGWIGVKSNGVYLFNAAAEVNALPWGLHMNFPGGTDVVAGDTSRPALASLDPGPWGGSDLAISGVCYVRFASGNPAADAFQLTTAQTSGGPSDLTYCSIALTRLGDGP